ncbi:MAG: cytochrome c [Burkholderiaceae bacterium]
MKLDNSAAAIAGTLGLALAGLLQSGTAAAADPEQGRAKAEQICSACHGKDGNTPIDPTYPRLAGQHADYLAQSMLAYKRDDRKNAIMGAQAKLLSRQDIDNLAAYYASLPGSLAHKHKPAR